MKELLPDEWLPSRNTNGIAVILSLFFSSGPRSRWFSGSTFRWSSSQRRVTSICCSRLPKAAAALSLDGTKEALQAVAGGLKSVNDEVLRASGADPSADARTNEEQTHDRFRDVMVPFAESADGAVSSAKALEAEATERMKKATEFYGEPFKADNAGRIFKLVADFLLAFDKVQEDMRKEAELAEKKKKREEAAKIRKSASVAELGADDPGGDEPGEDGVPRRKKRRAPPKQPRRQLDIRDEMHDELKAKAPRMDEEESPASKLARMQKLGFTSTAQLLEHDAETKRKAERAGGVRDADEDKGAKKQKPPPGTSGARGAGSSDARQVRHTSSAGSPSTPPAPPPPSASPPRDAFGAGSATLTVRVAARGAGGRRGARPAVHRPRHRRCRCLRCGDREYPHLCRDRRSPAPRRPPGARRDDGRARDRFR